MALIKYTGLAHFRELAAADFKKLGAEGQKALTWAKGEVKEVEDDVADVLEKFLGDEFTKVKEDAKTATKKNDSASSPSASSASSTTSAGSPSTPNQ